MPEISQDAFEVKNPLTPLVTPEIMRARANSSQEKREFFDMLSAVRKRDASESEIGTFDSWIHSTVRGFKRQLGHR